MPKFLFAALAVLSLSACTTTFEATNVDPTTGRFAVAKQDEVPATAISVRAPFDIDGVKALVFVRSNISEIPSYDAYFETQLKKLGNLARSCAKKNLSVSWSNLERWTASPA